MKHKILKQSRMLVLYVTLALVLTFSLVLPVMAQEPLGDQVRFGSNFTLEAEQKVEGDVAVFGGNVELLPSSQVDGDVVVVGGNAKIDGTVTGNIGVVGGVLELGNKAVVEGDVGLVGSELKRAEGAVVEGEIQRNRFDFNFGEEAGIGPIPTPSAPSIPPIPDGPFEPDRTNSMGWVGRVIGFFEYVIGNIVMLVGLAVVSWLVATFMPQQMKVTGDTVSESALLSFGVGALTAILVAVVGGILAITICLAPVSAIAFFIAGLALLFGWVVMGQLIGERLLLAAGRPFPNLVTSTVFGVLALTIVATMPVLEKIPCLGFILGLGGGLIGFVIGMAGLGAVILTRFGTRPYPQPEYGFGGGAGSSPRPSSGGGGDPKAAAILALERSEAELRAKIKAALAEADAAETTKPAQPPVVEQPADNEPVGDTPPADETPAPDKPGDEDNEPTLPDKPKP